MSTTIIDAGDADYPEGVREAPRVARWCQHAPPTLYLRGKLPPGPAVSIIGSRQAGTDACAYAARLAAHLAKVGWCIVSGGAQGIDAAAHRGALDGGAQTVSVLTGGHDLPPFPPDHAALFEEIVAQGGGLLSLEPDGRPRQRYQFLHRNVLMVALTCVTIVLHASQKGGAIKAAQAARDLGRPVFFVPECPWRDTARGSLDALREGARPLWCIEDAAATLAPFAILTPQDLDADQRCFWNAASHEPQHIDRLTRMAELPRERAVEAALMLLLDGHLEEGPAGHYRRVQAG